MQRQTGFTLVEVIAATVLLGIIAVFGTIFLTTGMRGALNSRLAEENGQKAQIALERIALELREAESGPGAGGAIQVLGGPARIVYSTNHASLPGTRTLQYNSGAGALTLTTVVAGVTSTNTLVDGVASCAMSFTGTTTTTVLTVTFTLTNAPGSFSITAKPRNAVATPVTS